MKGSALTAAVCAALRDLSPDCTVREAFTGALCRRPARPLISVGLLGEASSGGADTAEIGVWLFRSADGATEGAAVDLFQRVSDAAKAAGCTVQRLVLGETVYDKTTDCLTARCVLTAVTGAGGAAGETVYINGAPYTAEGHTVAFSESVRHYGAVGEETPPHTVRERTYTVTLTGFSGGEAFLTLRDFAASVGGVRYFPCGWKSVGGARAVFCSANAERLTESGGGA